MLEILLVLAVFVAITAMAVPAAHSIFTGQQIRGAADIVRARFSNARVQAIRTGDIYGFFYRTGSGEYWVAPMVTGFRSLANGTTPTAHQYVLENDIVFVSGETAEDARSAATQELAAAESDQFSQFRPILFYPDGTAQNANIFLQARNGLLIQVSLRGLTGTATRSGFLDEGGQSQ